MRIAERDTRQSIIDTARALLNETDDVDKITVRMIAERVGVGVGLINYHFKSKENLLSIAIGDVMLDTIRSFSTDDLNLNPVEKFRSMMKELVDIGSGNAKLMHFVLSCEITGSSMQTPLHLIPLLKEIYGNKKDDVQLRILAMQILDPIQLAALNPVTFHMYSGMDLQDPEQRHRFVDILIDNMIDPDGEKRGI